MLSISSFISLFSLGQSAFLQSGLAVMFSCTVSVVSVIKAGKRSEVVTDPGFALMVFVALLFLRILSGVEKVFWMKYVAKFGPRCAALPC